MIDVQNQPDTRKIKIRQAGVSRFRLPLLISDDGKIQPVTAEINFTVSLSEKFRGTHMSRLTEILTERVSKPLSIPEVENILNEALQKLDTDFAAIKIDFKFFVKRTSPVSGLVSYPDIDCEFSGELHKENRMNFSLTLKVPFTSLCPCSKEISDFGAHNQRSLCGVKLTFKDPDKLNKIKIDEIAGLIENCGSGQIYPLLKREDEKFVTEKAYNNPKFVEDILRDAVLAVRKIENLSAFEIECENFESIHNHNAFAAYGEKLFTDDAEN